MSIWFQCAWMWRPNMPPQSSIWTAVSRIHPRMIKTPDAEKTGKCLSRKNLSDRSKKLQHWSYRICSRSVHSLFLKESCRVLSYKSKIDLTGVHCRWILKMKVKCTFFHRFSVFFPYLLLPVLVCFCSFLNILLWKYLALISKASKPADYQHLFGGVELFGHWPCEVANSIVGSYWIVLDPAEDKWHSVGSLASENRLLPYYILSAFLHAPVFPFGSHFQEPIQRRISQESF